MGALRTVMTVQAVVLLVYGLPLLFAPRWWTAVAQQPPVPENYVLRAFYAFANVSGVFGRRVDGDARAAPLRGSIDVAAFLLEHARVAVVPGVDFGSDAYVRLSYATSDALIGEGLSRMEAALRRLG